MQAAALFFARKHDIMNKKALPVWGGGDGCRCYMFVPDGSGALINLNNGCKNAAYSQNIYGIDPVVQSYVVTEYTEDARIPVFGMKNGR